MYHGTVKWFNNAKGYGFIVSDSFNEDLFTHYSSINIDGYKTLKAGQAVTFDTTPGKNGLHAIDINTAATQSVEKNSESALSNDIDLDGLVPNNTTPSEHAIANHA